MSNRQLALASLVLVILLNRVQCRDFLEYQVMEEQPSHTLIGNVVFDAGLNERYSEDVVGQLRFNMLQTNEYFQIGSDSDIGQLRTTQILDRDSICPSLPACEIRLDIAVLPIAYYQVIKVSIELQDLNDNWPIFDQERIFLAIPENVMIGATFALPNAEDLDSGQFGVESYALEAPIDTFEVQLTKDIQGSTDIKLVIKDKLDRKSQDFYSLALVASDGGSPPKTGSVAIDVIVIDINDNHPRFFSNHGYEIYINETTTSPSVILQVHAFDPDEGQNGEIVYEFSNHTRDIFGDLFSVDKYTGNIAVIGYIDYELASEYNLTVVARNSGPESLAGYTTVRVRVLGKSPGEDTPSGNAEITSLDVMSFSFCCLTTIAYCLNINMRDLLTLGTA